MAVQQTVQGTQKAKTAVEAENAARTAEAAEMAGKCSQSAQNADKMGQMPQMPQMPQSPGSGAGSGLSDLTDNSDVGKQDTKVSDLGGETARIDAVSLGDASNAASVEGIPSSPISAISGNSEGFAGSASGGGGKDFAPPPMRGTMGKLNGSGASGDGAGGIHSGVSKEGDAVAAGAAGKAENNANEINFGGGARNMLGLKPKEGEEDLSALAAFAAGDTPKVAGMNADASGQGGRGLGSVKGSHATTIAEDASSIFKMVKTRYLRLQGNGKI